MEVTIKEEGDVTCPTCQKEVNLGKEGLEGLARNVFLEKMLEVQRITGGVVWSGVVGVVWCGVVWCGWCGVVWLVWCGVVWLVWCGVV